MISFILSILTQVLPFMPLAIGISTSYNLLRATDMSLDGSFVLGAVVFAKLLTLGCPPFLSAFVALLGGALVGVFVSFIQRGGHIDSLLAGVLVVFILTSLNLIILGRPNVNLSSLNTLFSSGFSKSQWCGWFQVTLACLSVCFFSLLFMSSRAGLLMRSLGDNPRLLGRLGYPLELIRSLGFSFTNLLAASSGIITSQIVGYADISMGLGMTLTGICAILLGQQITRVFITTPVVRTGTDFLACLIGVFVYFLGLNFLLRLDIDPLYLKMSLGLLLIFFLRTANMSKSGAA